MWQRDSGRDLLYFPLATSHWTWHLALSNLALDMDSIKHYLFASDFDQTLGFTTGGPRLMLVRVQLRPEGCRPRRGRTLSSRVVTGVRFATIRSPQCAA